MRTDKNTTATPKRPRPTMPERLYNVAAMLSTVRQAFRNQMDETGIPDLYDLSLTTSVAQLMVEDMAEELENLKMGEA